MERDRKGMKRGEKRFLKKEKKERNQEIAPIHPHLPLTVLLLSSLPPVCVRVGM